MANVFLETFLKDVLDRNKAGDNTAQLSGLSASLDEVSGHGKASHELLLALGQGAQDSHAREAVRLTQKHGADHPYVRAANDRSAALRGLMAHVDEATHHVGRLTENFDTHSMFHGYVYANTGGAVQDAVVELRLFSGSNNEHKPTGKFQAKTDERGYFRMELSQCADARNICECTGKPCETEEGQLPLPEKARSGCLCYAADMFRCFFARIMGREPSHRMAAKKTAGGGNDMRGGGELKSVTGQESAVDIQLDSRVYILDGEDNSKLLLTDSHPPQFSGQLVDGVFEFPSQFRIYTLP